MGNKCYEGLWSITSETLDFQTHFLHSSFMLYLIPFVVVIFNATFVDIFFLQIHALFLLFVHLLLSDQWFEKCNSLKHL